uniref:Uncharacterized protein n=1 Tax=Anguilla anguilla TaxID=7936 RepID=A0A0E9XE63_ANGAN
MVMKVVMKVHTQMCINGYFNTFRFHHVETAALCIHSSTIFRAQMASQVFCE